MGHGRKGRRLSLIAGLAVPVSVLLAGWLCRAELRVLYLLIRDFEWLGDNAEGYPEYRHEETGIVFVEIPSATFRMGSPEHEEGRQDEEMQHDVTVSRFLMAKFETSQAEWHRVMGSNLSFQKGESLPVKSVSWTDCREFCEATGFDLPTEAQWEYACRGRTRGPYAVAGFSLSRVAWYGESGGSDARSVGGKKPNGFGLYDMHGNVAEWCRDTYDEGFYSRPEASGRDPVCTAASAERVTRGGSWLEHAWFLRSAYRMSKTFSPNSSGSKFFGSRYLEAARKRLSGTSALSAES